MVYLIGKQPTLLQDIKAYNNNYALAKIIALWRQRFPVPT